MAVYAGDIGEEDPDTWIFEPTDEPGEIPIPVEPAVPVTVPVREPVPA